MTVRYIRVLLPIARLPFLIVFNMFGVMAPSYFHPVFLWVFVFFVLWFCLKYNHFDRSAARDPTIRGANRGC